MQIIYMVTQCLSHYFMMKLNLIRMLNYKILNTPNISDIGFFVEVDLTCPDNIKAKSD